MPYQSPKSFTVFSTGISNVLTCSVGISKPFKSDQDYSINNHSPINYKKYFTAIWDTGATRSVISSKVVQECGLSPTGMAKVFTANGEMVANVYRLSVFLPNKIVFPYVAVTEGKIADTEDVLIGMDIINSGDFAVTNFDGQTVFSFRIPSCGMIDFTMNP